MHCPSAKTCTLAILQNAHPKAITRITAFITSSRDTVGPLTRRLAGAACANEQRRSAAATTRLLGRQYSCQLQKPHTPSPVSLRDTLRPTAPFTQPWKCHTSLAATTNTTREYASEAHANYHTSNASYPGSAGLLPASQEVVLEVPMLVRVCYSRRRATLQRRSWGHISTIKVRFQTRLGISVADGST